jgi:hypothetical protein
MIPAKSRRGRHKMMITNERKAEKIKSRLLAHIDEFALLLAEGEKITLIPSRTCFKAFAAKEHRLNLDLDNKSLVGGAVDE